MCPGRPRTRIHSFSVGFVIVELYERIGYLLYGQSFIDNPAQPDYAFHLPKLDGA